MPSFFIPANDAKKQRKRGKRPAPTSNEKEQRMTRRQRMMANTEIISDDEEDYAGNKAGSAGSEDEYEDTHERNFRQAKELLAKLEAKTKDDEEADISALLREDAAKRAGTLHKDIADSFEINENNEKSHRGHRFSPLSVAISACGKFVVSAGKESSIVKFSIAENQVVGVIKRSKKVKEEQKAHYGHIFAVAISSDGRYIVSGGHDSVIKVWDFNSLVHIRDFSGHLAPITDFCFQLKTNLLFSSSRDRTVKLWDLDQLGLVDTMHGHQDSILSVSALLKQRVVTAGAQDRSCRLWKVEDESQLVFNGLSSCISMDCVAMLNDDHFVSGSADGSLSVWSVWKKRPICIRKQVHGVSATGESRWVVSVSAVPYSDLIATGSNDGELKVWKVSKDYTKISQVYAYETKGFINDIKFSSDGTLLAVAAAQEHKYGRWWVDKEAENRIFILPVSYGTPSNDVLMVQNNRTVIASDDETDNSSAEE